MVRAALLVLPVHVQKERDADAVHLGLHTVFRLGLQLELVDWSDAVLVRHRARKVRVERHGVDRLQAPRRDDLAHERLVRVVATVKRRARREHECAAVFRERVQPRMTLVLFEELRLVREEVE